VAFVLAEASPYSERFARGEGAFSTQLKDGAAVAVLLGGFRASAACSSAFALRVEEEIRVGFSARALILPFPLGLCGGWQGGDYLHRAPRSVVHTVVFIDWTPPRTQRQGRNHRKPDERDSQERPANCYLHPRFYSLRKGLGTPISGVIFDFILGRTPDRCRPGYTLSGAPTSPHRALDLGTWHPASTTPSGSQV